MLSVVTVLSLLLAHWIGDFVFQSDEMAKKKSKDFGVLLGHCAVWTWAMLTAMFFLGMSVVNSPYALVLLFTTHVFIDAVTSKINAELWEEGKIHSFFVMVGFDQFLHLAQILSIAVICGLK